MSMTETAGYAQPEQPIHVTMAGDEERFTEGDGAFAAKVTVPPPAYGLWRSSVVRDTHTGMAMRIVPLTLHQRLDPDLLHWQRVENQPAALRNTERGATPSRKPHGRRPPSYMSDDGVQYVVEAQPRSFTGYSLR